MSRLMNLLPAGAWAAARYTGSSRSTTFATVPSKPQWDSCGTTEETLTDT